MQAASASIEALGCVVFASFPNQGLWAVLTSAQAQILGQMPAVRLVSFSAVSLSEANGDDGAYAAILGWNAHLRPIAANIAAASPRQDHLDALYVPDRDRLDADNSPLAPDSPDMYQPSEFMIRNVQVDVFLVESNGAIDGDTENWTTGMRDQVITEITNGVTWWISADTQDGWSNALLTANITFHTPFNEPAVVATGYEPISNSSADDGLWIQQIMSNLGYTSSSKFTNLYSYDHSRRIMGRDWVFTIFVVNSLNDADGAFSNGDFAYAYVNGPYMVMTYDNEVWGIGNMEVVTAHGMGHIFGALDEAAVSGCTDTQTSGYLNIQNTNCENGVPATENSIMRSAATQYNAYLNYQISTPVRGMIGWRDTDGDGIYDPDDTIPVVSLAAYTPDPTTDTTPTWSGTVSDTPWDSPTHNDTTTNYLNAVQYRIDSGVWVNCIADDGVFDETSETFTCTPSTLSGGLHTIYVQARNRVNNLSAVISDQVTIDVIPLTAPSDLIVSGASQTQINLRWADNSGDETAFNIERSLNGSTGWTQIGQVSAGVTSYSSAGLTCNKTYYYRVRAYRSGDGQYSSYTNTANAATQACNPPAAPSNLTTSAISLTQISLSWTDNSSDETAFYIERSPNGSTGWVEIATVGAGVIIASDTGLTCSTPYYYRVRAYRSGDAQYSGYSNNGSGATVACNAPAAPSNLITSAASQTQINLEWADNSSDEADFHIERSPNGSTGWAEIATVSAGVISYSNIGLTCNTSYYYRVRAYRSSDEQYSGYSSNANAATQLCDPPAAPSNLTASTFSQQAITLKWADNSSDESDFHIERSPDGSAGWLEVLRVGAMATRAYDPNLTCGKTYYYRMRAHRNADGQYSSYSNIASAATQACSPPTAPSGLVANAASQTQINLDWTDASSDESDFHIERSPNGSSSWVEIATVSAGVATYNNSGLTCGTAYYYRARAHRHSDSQYSAYSNTANTTTLVCNPPAAPSGLNASAASQTQIDLGWTDASSDESDFHIERSPNGSSSWVEITTVSAGVTTYNNTGLTCDKPTVTTGGWCWTPAPRLLKHFP